MADRLRTGADVPLAALLDEFARTKHARACVRPAGAYSNCLAVSVRCAEWLRARDAECGMLHVAGSHDPFPEAAGRWAFCDPSEYQHWTARAGNWSIDWTARQFRPQAGWPMVEPVEALAARWTLTEDWACTRCPQLVLHDSHRELAPRALERLHRELARATHGGGPFGDPRHDDTPALTSLCRCNGTRSRRIDGLQVGQRRNGARER